MGTTLTKRMLLAVAMALALAAMRPAMAQTGQQSPEAQAAPSGALPDYHGTPIIMRGLTWPKDGPAQESKPAEHAKRPRQAPRGSGTYIPPPVPSLGIGTPPAALLGSPPQPYKSPPIKSFGDRVIDCIHSYPLNKGIGGNPTDQQMYIRQCANGP